MSVVRGLSRLGPRSRLPIRARLTVAFALATALVVALIAAVVYARLGAELDEILDDSLRLRADDLAALVAGGGELSGGRLVEGDEGFSQVLTPAGEVVDSTLPAAGRPALDGPALRAALAAPTLRDIGALTGVEGEVRVLARPVDAEGERLVVVAGGSLQDRDDALAGLLGAFALGAPIALILASAIGYGLAGVALRPVEAMRRRAGEITLERSGERLPLPAADDEIRRLGATLNEMLDRLEAAFERERTFVADASHELRSPLTVLRAELELGLRDAGLPERAREVMRSAIEETDRLARLADDLLLIARADRGSLPLATEELALSPLVERVAARFAERAGTLDRAIEFDLEPALRVPADPLLLEQALGDLLDNALRHGEGTIAVRASADGDAARITVHDEGPGFEPGFAGAAFERFSRADAARSQPGAGLGLAIVAAIAAAHGGEARVEPVAGGAVTIRLPAPDQAERGVLL